MKTVRIFEYDSLRHADITEFQLKRLKAFDDSYARQKGTRRIFDWNTNGGKATSYVGVIQIPGLTLEILPKIDRPDANGDKEKKRSAQDNLLYMLSITRKVPIEERDLAGLNTGHDLLDSLIAIFTSRLLDELRKGLEHNYIHHEENLSILKGKLLFSQHIRHNASHQERAFVGFDEFIADTPLNRIFKVTCRRLLGMVSANSIQKQLRELLGVLDEVSDRAASLHDFDKVHLTRNNERFKPLFTFCRMLMLNQSSAPATGKNETFSLLFPMEQLFEEFIATIIQRHASTFFPNIHSNAIRIQAKGRNDYLMKHGDGSRRFLLKPDIIVDSGNDTPPCLILDTKWKRLQTTGEDLKNGVSQADIYQLYAYAKHYECRQNVLLYPKVKGVDPAPYCLMTDESTKICIELIDLNRDLRNEQKTFLQHLKQVLSPDTKTVIQ